MFYLTPCLTNETLASPVRTTSRFSCQSSLKSNGILTRETPRGGRFWPKPYFSVVYGCRATGKNPKDFCTKQPPGRNHATQGANNCVETDPTNSGAEDR